MGIIRKLWSQGCYPDGQSGGETSSCGMEIKKHQFISQGFWVIFKLVDCSAFAHGAKRTTWPLANRDTRSGPRTTDTQLVGQGSGHISYSECSGEDGI